MSAPQDSDAAAPGAWVRPVDHFWDRIKARFNGASPPFPLKYATVDLVGLTLAELVRTTSAEGGSPALRISRDPRKPSADRQRDILTVIRHAGMPLFRREIVEAMRLKTPGKLGANLAWMVENKVLVNVPNRGYWPAGEPIPQ